MSSTQDMDDISVAVATLPFLADKLVVDFANGLHVVQDHIRVQRQTSGFAARLVDGLTGARTARQTEINTNLVTGLEASLKWLGELSESLAQSNYALICVNNRLNALKQDTAKIANYAADTRQLLNTLERQVTQRYNALESELVRVDLVQRAHTNIAGVFIKWEAGHFQHLSLAGRCYAALEELYWGGFGDQQRRQQGSSAQRELREIVKNKILIHLSKDVEARRDTRVESHIWLQRPAVSQAGVLTEALQYLGDTANEYYQPFTVATTQPVVRLPLRMPRICSAERLGEALLNEVFEERLYV